jgi:ribonuclease HI
MLTLNSLCAHAPSQACLKLGLKHLLVYGDSKLVINQVARKWQCRHARLIPFRDAALAMLASLGRPLVKLEHVPRELNSRADALANQAVERHDFSAGCGGAAAGGLEVESRERE